MGLSFGKCGTCRGKTFESGSGNARDVTGTGGEESQVQGDGPDAERNIEREGLVLPARNGREGQRAAIHTGTFAHVGHAGRFFCPWRRWVRKTRGMARGAGRAYASALFVQRMWIGAYRFARTVGHHSGRGFGSHTNQQDRIAGKCVCGCFCLLCEQRIGGSGLPPTDESHLEGGF